MLNRLVTSYVLKWLRSNLGKKNFFTLFKQIQNVTNEGLCYGNDSIIQEAEKNLIDRLISTLPANPVVFDVGANRGNYLSNWLKHKPALHAFEPSLENGLFLKEEFGDKVVVSLKALGDLPGTFDYFIVREDSRLNSLLRRNHSNHQWELGNQVECTTLDAYCVENEINHIDFLKIDVEGFELAVLKGAKHMLPSIKYIQFEFGGTHIEAKVFFKNFYELLIPNFKLYHILIDGIVEIAEYDEKLENFKGTNFLAARKSVI